MVPPPTKKRKTDPSTPVIFTTAGGLKPDVRFSVLGKEYHVHSALLKLHSAFFAKFLDSADKTTGQTDASTNAQFQYHWITKVDDDPKEHAKGGWSLIAKPSILNDENSYHAYAGDEVLQQSCFEKLLCAIYSQPYSLTRLKQLETLVTLADYYRCLPILSHSINNALLHVSSKTGFIPYNASKVMVHATKIKHRLLFMEGLIFAAGSVKWGQVPEFEELTDVKIKTAARTARSALMAKIVYVQQLLHATSDDDNDDTPMDMREALLKSMSENVTSALPCYFRRIFRDGPWNRRDDQLDSELEGILKSNLHFCRELQAGIAGFEDNFFCVEISDEDLPVCIFPVTGETILAEVDNGYSGMLRKHVGNNRD